MGLAGIVSIYSSGGPKAMFFLITKLLSVNKLALELEPDFSDPAGACLKVELPDQFRLH